MDKNTKDHDSDDELIRRFQAGDRGAFDKLVRRHKGPVFNLCYRFLGDRQDAEDSAQDIFVKVYRSLRGFRFRSSFSTWLYRISVNTCINRVGSLEYRSRKKSVQLDSVVDHNYSYPSMDTEVKIETPAAELERKERMKLIQNAINSLPVKQKTLIVLRDIEGLSYDEITRITGLRTGTLKSRLSRARLYLREKLRGII
jgi:RNA polymerase sigma-70 factor (ECF subfamily)